MNVVQNGTDLGLTGLASEFKRAGDASENSSAITKSEQQDKVNADQKITEENEVTQPLTTKQLEKVAQQLQDFVGDLNRSLEFSVDKDSGRDVIKVFDRESGDLLKQFPSEEVLTLVSKLSDMVGGFIDAKV